MVKFQKQLEGQLVPEWKEAYVDYKQLKKDLRQIRQQMCNQAATDGAPCGAEPYVRNAHDCHNTLSPLPRDGKSIIIHHKGHESCGSNEELYETELIDGSAPWQENDKIFFSRLDSHLNMVNNFYNMKERESMVRGKQLEVQMETLLDIQGKSAVCEIDDRPNNREKFQEDSDIESRGVVLCKMMVWSKDDLLCMSKSKVTHAKKMLRTAFIEYYKALTLLQNYSCLNTLAFAKILKKYDKVVGKHVMDTYFKVVESSYFSSSKKVVNAIEKVEALFTRHFTKNNRREALGYLRPSSQQNSNNKSFLLGVYSGCSWSLLMALVLMLSQSHAISYLRSSTFITNIFPFFSTLILLVFHIYMYAFNVYLWRRMRINYAFIYEFALGTELRSLEIMLLSTALTTFLMTSILVHLFLATKGPSFTKDSEIIPVATFMGFLGFAVVPFNICYKSTRFFLLRCVWRIICSPLYKVEFVDFFVADQFISQITALRNLEYISCYYISRYDKALNSSTYCSQNHFIQNLQHIIAVLPYWWRLMQCARRWSDEKDHSQIANGIKYLLGLIAILIRFTYETNRTRLCLALYIVSSTIASIYQFYWDVVMDWGLLQPQSVNPWLRDQLILKSKTPYFISMVVNALLRLSWLYSIIYEALHFGAMDPKYVDFIFGMTEIGRRGLWNFYRLENEHLNNVGKFRAVKIVPLPFKDIDQDV